MPFRKFLNNLLNITKYFPNVFNFFVKTTSVLNYLGQNYAVVGAEEENSALRSVILEIAAIMLLAAWNILIY